MISLVETKGQSTTVSLYTTMDKALEEMLRRYNVIMKEIERYNWKDSWISLEERYAKIDDWEDIVEWRVTENVTFVTS